MNQEVIHIDWGLYNLNVGTHHPIYGSLLRANDSFLFFVFDVIIQLHPIIIQEQLVINRIGMSLFIFEGPIS